MSFLVWVYRHSRFKVPKEKVLQEAVVLHGLRLGS